MHIHLDNISFTRGNQEFHFNLSIPQGQKVAIIGESGAGKSTLINLIAGFVPFTQGNLYINQKKANNLLPSDRECFLVFQENNHFPHLTIAKNIALAFAHSKLSTGQKNEQIEQILSRLNIKEIANKLPQNCSGGQLQRAALARGFLFPRSILLLDEPLSALDPENAANVVSYLQEQEKTILIVTHDLEAVSPIVDRVICIRNGHIIEDYLIKKNPSA
ncbi:ATP-binding cassette domain-containing protein [Psittacicella gerlachiana]|uniref:ABC transporter domain-containing protein n=1 Tax=Psittacicella gerlachiana TaxID=2028574 RepID=A0A3A1Y8T5_9GAMM|nr:ATP-binding cassette domain-containing protein [Psittacicella gerlachiana]RIY33618.1 hypothetical protein CKF59_06280 [Psittacicella gerlachiana]